MKRVSIQQMESKLESKENLELITRRIVGKLLNNPNFQDLKFKLLDLRKKYVKRKKGDANSDEEISRDFINYVEKELNVDIN